MKNTNNVIHIREQGLKTFVAKEIKKCERSLKDKDKDFLVFEVSLHEGSVRIAYREQIYIIDNMKPNTDVNKAIEVIMDVYNIILEAIEESRVRTTINVTGGLIQVKVVSKPRKAFNMLSRLLSKYANLTLQWDTITKFPLDNSFRGTTYLCHDTETCERAIKFIRTKRNGRDKLFATIITTLDRGFVDAVLELSVTTPKGKFKYGETFHINP